MVEFKKSGRVSPEDYQRPSFQRRLEPLVAALRAELGAAAYDGASLGATVAGLMQFQEDVLGVGVPPANRPCPKIPARLLEDATPKTGALHQVAALLFRRARAAGGRAIDWASAARRRDNLQVLAGLRRDLEARGHLRPPLVFVHPRCGPEAGRLREAVKRLGGRLAASEGEASHVVVPTGRKGAGMDEAAGRNRMRSLLVDEESGLARVHWLYLPPSYDEWVPAASAPPPGSVGLGPDRHEPAAAPPARPVQVYAQWVVDSDRYNEWMEDADYVEDKGESGAPAGVRLGVASAAAAGGAPAAAAAAAAGAGGAAAAGGISTTAAAAAAAAQKKQEAASIAKAAMEQQGGGAAAGGAAGGGASAAEQQQNAAAAGAAAAGGVAPASAPPKPPASAAAAAAAAPGAPPKPLKSALKQPPQPQLPPQPPKPTAEVVVLTPAQQLAEERRQVAVVQAAKRARLEAQLPEVDPSPAATVALAPHARQRRALAPARGALDGGGAGENISQGQLAPWLPAAGVGYAHHGPQAPYFGPAPLPASLLVPPSPLGQQQQQQQRGQKRRLGEGAATAAATTAAEDEGAAAAAAVEGAQDSGELRALKVAARWVVEHSLPTQAHWFRTGEGRIAAPERLQCVEFFARGQQQQQQQQQQQEADGGPQQTGAAVAAAASNGDPNNHASIASAAPTPRTYVEWRDLIVREWRRRVVAAAVALASAPPPSQTSSSSLPPPPPPGLEPLPVRLTLQDARALAPRAEAPALRTVLEALEYWGVVNGPLTPRAEEAAAAAAAILLQEQQQQQEDPQGQEDQQQPQQSQATAATTRALARGAAAAAAEAVEAVTRGAPLLAQRAGRVTVPPGAAGLFQFTQPTLEEAVDAATTRGGLLSAVPARDGVHAPAPGGGGRRAGGGLNAAQAQAAAQALVAAPGQRVRCSAMPWVDCTELRYHSVRHPAVRLCPQAFAEGRFPSGSTARDFVRVDQRGGGGGEAAPPSVGVDGRALRLPTDAAVSTGAGAGAAAAAAAAANAAAAAAANANANNTNTPSAIHVPATDKHAPPPWTALEDYVLLEAIDQHGAEDWGLVAERVGTRSEVQCMLRFASLPIEEALLEAPPLPPALMAKVERLAPGLAAAAAQRAGNGAGVVVAGGAVAVAEAVGAGAAASPQDAAVANAFARAAARVLGARDGSRVPFLDSDNPVAAVVSFVFSMVSPRLSACVAQAAIEVLTEDDPLAAAASRLGLPWPPPPAPASPGGAGMGEEDSAAAAASAALWGTNGAGGLVVGDEAAALAEAAAASAAAAAATAAMGRAVATSELPKRPVTRAQCVAAAAVAFAYAATRARVLAEQDEREIQRLMVTIVDVQLKKVEAKSEWLEGGCALEEEGDQEEDEGAAAGVATTTTTTLHASVVADTRYLLRERERLEKDAAKLLQQPQPQVLPLPGAAAPSGGGGPAASAAAK